MFMNNAQIAQRIKDTCKIKGCSISKMLEFCNIRSGLIYDLEKRDYTPSIALIEKIADYFNVSVDYLLGRTDNTSISNSIELNITGRDKEILTAYKNNPDVQLAVDRLLKIESENNNKNINIQTAYVAARSTDDTPPRIETGDFNDILNAPDSTDE